MCYLFVFIATLLLASPVQCAVIDDLEDLGANDAVVNSRLIDGVEVTISTVSAREFRASTYNTNTNFGFNSNNSGGKGSGERFIATSGGGDGNGNFPFVVPITFEFSHPVLEFGFTTIDLLENGAGNSGEFVALQALDQGGDPIVEQRRNTNQGSNGIVLEWKVATAPNQGFTKAIFTGTLSGSAFNAFGVDDLLVSAAPPIIPEPQSILLLLIGGCVAVCFRS